MGHWTGLLSIGIALLAAGLAYAQADGRPVVDPAEIDAMPEAPSAMARIAEIRLRVQEAVVYPPLARRRGIEGTTLIEFLIDAKGQASEISTVESSGSPSLDAAAEQGAREAAPLPYVFGRLRIPVVFEITRLGSRS
ncbi:MAG: energy transducer TonB [bacterium]|nr:energy transducer TonB [bacterium]MCP5070393.1 energy transducer TonB [bacterium]